MDAEETIALTDFAEELGLTYEQVLGEIIAGRLAFTRQGGETFTSRFAVLDWIHRRAYALWAGGRENVAFPIFDCDLDLLEELNEMQAKAAGAPA